VVSGVAKGVGGWVGLNLPMADHIIDTGQPTEIPGPYAKMDKTVTGS